MTTGSIYRFPTADRILRDDPWSVFGELRERGEIIRIRLPFIGKTWAATSYDSVNSILKDAELFARDPKNAGRKYMIPMQWMLPRSLITLAVNMIAFDGNDHRRLRTLVDQAFAMRNVDGMAEQIEKSAAAQMDKVEEIAKRDGQVDLIENFASQIPLTVICELLGLPLEDRPQFRKWFSPFSGVSSVASIFKVGWNLRKLIRYLKEQFKQVRIDPRPGLMTELVQVELEGDRLTETELLAMVFLLLAAGHETTVHLISNSVFTLFQHPRSREELLSDWTMSHDFIEEVLRYASPLQMAKPRYVTRDMEYRNVTLTKGEMVTPMIAAANYDPARFESPETFDMHRPKNYHMSFGSGAHTCLGMKLARTETEHALKSLFQRWPDVTPAFDLAQPDWSTRIATRGFKTLVVKPRT